MKKRIFVFKPTALWKYMGGGRVIIADTFDEAAAFFPDDKMLVNDLPKDSNECVDVWFLVASYIVEGDPPKGIVLDDWNWG